MASGMPSSRAHAVRTASRSGAGCRARALLEEGDGVLGAERRNAPDDLARHAERFAARGQHRHAGAGTRQLGGQLRGGLDDVFAVVQAHEHPAVAELPGQRGDRVPVRRGEDPGGRRDQLGDDEGVAGGRQVGPADAVPPVCGLRRRRLDRQPGLSAAAGTGDGDQPRVAQRGGEGAQLRFAADEGRRRNREIVSDRGHRATVCQPVSRPGAIPVSARWPMFRTARSASLDLVTEEREGDPKWARSSPTCRCRWTASSPTRPTGSTSCSAGWATARWRCPPPWSGRRSACPRRARRTCASRWRASARWSRAGDLFDITHGWGGTHPLGVPVVVVTHEPCGRPPGDLRLHAARWRRR